MVTGQQQQQLMNQHLWIKMHDLLDNDAIADINDAASTIRAQSTASSQQTMLQKEYEV
jgi:hypothetical protein